MISIPVKYRTSISNPVEHAQLRSQFLSKLRNFDIISISVKHTQLQSHFLQTLNFNLNLYDQSHFLPSQLLPTEQTEVNLFVSSFLAIQIKQKTFNLAILKFFQILKPEHNLIRQYFQDYIFVFLNLKSNSAVIQVLVFLSNTKLLNLVK